MTQAIPCQVLHIVDGEEVFVGNANVHSPPRAGEHIWFSEKRSGHTSWLVDEVAHHVGNGELGNYPLGFQTLVIYAVPTYPKMNLEGAHGNHR